MASPYFRSLSDPRKIGRQALILFPIVVITTVVAGIILFLPQPGPSTASPELSVAGAATTTYPGG